MFVLYAAKRATVLRPLARSFGSSARWARSDGHSDGQSHAAVQTPLATPLAASHNYDAAQMASLRYQVAVAFQPKSREVSNTFRKPSAAVSSPSGEDNLFVSQEKDGYVAVGVADGVGGWSEAGYDSLAISRELCWHSKQGFEASAPGSVLPKQLLSLLFAAVQKLPKVEIGGTTACLGVLTPDRKLHVANLGDSWCGVFRDYGLVHETKFQTHNFNTPFQLAKIPVQILKQAEAQGKRYIIDLPDNADEYVWDLRQNDIVVFATDGVTDNVVPGDMEIFLRDHFSAGTPDLADVASKFVQEVVKVSKDANFPSAFAQELSRLTGQRYLGGKEDDITVVMVQVK